MSKTTKVDTMKRGREGVLIFNITFNLQRKKTND